jgi:hypothetical protein
MGVTPNDGDSFGDFGVEPHNLQKKEDRASKARGFQKFPMMLHKPNRLTKLVGTSEKADPAEREAENEKQLAVALKAGWLADVRDVPGDEDGDGVPDAISQMTVDQAASAIRKADAKQLAAYEADEQSHGNREPIVSLLSDAKDRIAHKGKPKADGEKPKAKAKGKPKADAE